MVTASISVGPPSASARARASREASNIASASLPSTVTPTNPYAAAEASERARRGEGPTLIEAETMRMHGHGAHDDMRYVPKEMFEVWEKRDPIDRYEKKLSDDGIDIEEIRASVKEEIEKETEWALEQPMPDPATAREGVFATEDPKLGDGNAPWSHWKQEAGNA